MSVASRCLLPVLALFLTLASPTLGFLYDDFSEGELNTSKWNLSCDFGCPQIVGINQERQTLQIAMRKEKDYNTHTVLNLIGYNFSSGDILNFDFDYSFSGYEQLKLRYDREYSGMVVYDHAIEQGQPGSYHVTIRFLSRSKGKITVLHPDNKTFIRDFDFPSDEASFFVTVSSRGLSIFDVQLDNFLIRPGFCGDGICDSKDEACATCDADCGCPSGETCSDQICLKRLNIICSSGIECNSTYCVHGLCRNGPTYCGDYYCDVGEGCSSCETDCGCLSDETCSREMCLKKLNVRCSSDADCDSTHCVHGTCRERATFCGDRFCDAGEDLRLGDKDGLFCLNDCGKNIITSWIYPIAFFLIVAFVLRVNREEAARQKHDEELRRQRGLRERKRKAEEERRTQEQEERARRLEEEAEERKRRKEQAFRRAQLAKGLVEYNGAWITKAKFTEIRAVETGLQQNFMNLTGYQFEEFVANLFQRMGYRTTTTPKSQDYGIDVVAKGHSDVVAIQCKRFDEGQNVGNRDIQRARGSMDFYKANKCIVVTNQDFTVQAKDQARRTKYIELWGKRTLHEMVRTYFIDRDLENLTKKSLKTVNREYLT